MDWSLLGCGWSGHVTYAPAEPELRARLSVPTADGLAWRCLRCGTFVAGEPAGSGPAAAAPEPRRDKDLRGAISEWEGACRCCGADFFVLRGKIRFKAHRQQPPVYVNEEADV